MLIAWCTAGDKKGVLYRDLVSLLDWKTQPDTETIVRLTQACASPPKTATEGNPVKPSSQLTFSN